MALVTRSDAAPSSVLLTTSKAPVTTSEALVPNSLHIGTVSLPQPTKAITTYPPSGDEEVARVDGDCMDST